MPQINTYTDNEITIVAEARRQVAAGIAPVGLVERAYRVIERYPHDPADNGIIAAAMDFGVLQMCFLEDAEWTDGWSRLKVRQQDGSEEAIDLLVFRQHNPDRLFFDVEVKIAAGRIAKALPKSDPRQGEIATLTLACASIRKTLNRMVVRIATAPGVSPYYLAGATDTIAAAGPETDAPVRELGRLRSTETAIVADLTEIMHQKRVTP